MARSAYRLREGVEAGSQSFLCRAVHTLLVGANRMTPICSGSEPALLLGPLSVEPASRSCRDRRGPGDEIAGGGARRRACGSMLLVGDIALSERNGLSTRSRRAGLSSGGNDAATPALLSAEQKAPSTEVAAPRGFGAAVRSSRRQSS